MRFDVISIGSGTVDVFVRPKTTEIASHNGHMDVCYHIGEKVLIDELVLDTGGGGTNTSVAFARLGLKAGWLGVLGDDPNASVVRDALKKEGVEILGPTIAGMTAYSVIMVGLRKDRSILTYKGVADKLRTIPHLSTKWLYCSSMMGESFNTLVRIIKSAKKKGIKYAFNPSMYLASQGLKVLAPIIDDCDVLVLNKEEAGALTASRTGDLRAMLWRLQQHAKIVVITDGPNGAYATDGISMFTIRPRPIKVVETTGAGDSFAAGVVAGLVLGQDLATALQYGMAESESVIQYVGAKNVLLSRSALIKDARRYKVRKEAF
jgi:sugar/nucleoside kinase (ribokinase family)